MIFLYKSNEIAFLQASATIEKTEVHIDTFVNKKVYSGDSMVDCGRL